MDDCDEKYPKSWISCNSLKMFPLGRISIIAEIVLRSAFTQIFYLHFKTTGWLQYISRKIIKFSLFCLMRIFLFFCYNIRALSKHITTKPENFSPYETTFAPPLFTSFPSCAFAFLCTKLFYWKKFRRQLFNFKLLLTVRKGKRASMSMEFFFAEFSSAKQQDELDFSQLR
jgi:hypothetical protein